MILVINPGSTSTKIALYDSSNVIFQTTIRHSAEELSQYRTIMEQLPFRKRLVSEQLRNSGIDMSGLQLVIGRGGLIKPVKSGVYRVNDLMKQHLRLGFQGQHASNLGGLIADEIAGIYGKNIPAYIADPVVVDEMQPCARIAGHPLFERKSIFHALNQKAVARMYAQVAKRPYEELNLIVAHIGGGISVGAHRKGLVIDVNQALDGDGPFSPERSGTLPAGQLVDLCFSGKYTCEEIKHMLTGKGGLVAYCNSNDVPKILQRAQAGDERAKLILMALCYQVAKEIGAMAVVLKGNVDQIILTGGIAYNTWMTQHIADSVSFLAPVTVYPGEDEMAALAMNAQMALDHQIVVLEYR